MNFGDPSTFGTEMADRFVASGANLPPPLFQIGLRLQFTGEHKFIGSDSYLMYGNKNRIQMLTFTGQDSYYTHNT